MVVGVWISNRYCIWNCHRTLVFSIKWLVVLSTKKIHTKKMVSRVLFFICYPLANLRVLSFEFLWCPVIAVTRDSFDSSLRCSNHQSTDGAMPAPHQSSQNFKTQCFLCLFFSGFLLHHLWEIHSIQRKMAVQHQQAGPPWPHTTPASNLPLNFRVKNSE